MIRVYTCICCTESMNACCFFLKMATKITFALFLTRNIVTLTNSHNHFENIMSNTEYKKYIEHKYQILVILSCTNSGIYRFSCALNIFFSIPKDFFFFILIKKIIMNRIELKKCTSIKK